MSCTKGFSLIEVLLSLLVITSLALGLLEQQRQVRQLLTQIILKINDSERLRAKSERSFFKEPIS